MTIFIFGKTIPLTVILEIIGRPTDKRSMYFAYQLFSTNVTCQQFLVVNCKHYSFFLALSLKHMKQTLNLVILHKNVVSIIQGLRKPEPQSFQTTLLFQFILRKECFSVRYLTGKKLMQFQSASSKHTHYRIKRHMLHPRTARRCFPHWDGD